MGLLDSIGKIFTTISPIGAIASGVGSLIGAISGSKSQQKAVESQNDANLQIARENNQTSIDIARENNALQQSMLRENNEFNRQQAIDMFNLENAYNSPLAQVRRFSEAGLNPAIMMQGAGGTASGNSSASAPTAAAAGISPVMPTLTTPHMEAVPPMALGFIEAMASLSQIDLNRANARKAGSEKNRIDQLIPAELEEMFSRAENAQAQASYQRTMELIEKTYGNEKRKAEIKKTIADYSLACLKGETEKAQKLLLDAEQKLTNTKNDQLIEQAPVILQNLKEQGELIRKQQQTEKSKQAANYASAQESKERANLTRKEAKLLEDQHDDLVYARRLQNAKDFQELGEMAVTWQYRFEELRNRKLISDEQYKEVQEAVERAKKENTWFWWSKAIETAERINNGANKWAPWALSRDDVTPGQGMMYQSWQSTSTYGR